MPRKTARLMVLTRNVFSLFYQRQVKFTFSMDLLAELSRREWTAPDGYSLRSPDREADAEAWASLLNSDGNFGVWTAERIREEIFNRLATPDSASGVWWGKELTGCFSACDASAKGKKIGMGMWFIIKPAHRGKGLSYPLCFRTLAYFGREHYDAVYLTSDPFRLAALSFYLSNGAKPVYTSLLSPLQWWYIRIRLKRFKIRNSQ
ncbi:MAG TPA: hypothetical protein VGJ94_12480 [Syntrophorhabdaceae bacterium]|jgi:hypothetical protein